MQDTNKPMSGGYLEFSSGTINSRSHRKLKYSTVHDCEPFDGCGSKLQNSFGDSEFFHGVGNNSEDLWDGISVFSPFKLSLFPSYHDYYYFTRRNFWHNKFSCILCDIIVSQDHVAYCLMHMQAPLHLLSRMLNS